jgi:hypothetical protein
MTEPALHRPQLHTGPKAVIRQNMVRSQNSLVLSGFRSGRLGVADLQDRPTIGRATPLGAPRCHLAAPGGQLSCIDPHMALPVGARGKLGKR